MKSMTLLSHVTALSKGVFQQNLLESGSLLGANINQVNDRGRSILLKNSFSTVFGRFRGNVPNKNSELP